MPEILADDSKKVVGRKAPTPTAATFLAICPMRYVAPKSKLRNGP